MPLQLLYNSTITFTFYLIFAIGFVVIYRINKFFHFAQAVVLTTGAYLTLMLNQLLGLPIIFSTILAVICSCIVGCMIELVVYRHVGKKGGNANILLLTSLGIYIVLQNIISISFGDDTKSIRTWPVEEGINIFGARITPVQVIIIITSITLVILTAVYLKHSKTGKEMRAVANDPELAKISGINSDKVILISFAIGSALAGAAGILMALDTDMTPTMGMNALMMGVVAMIIGGGKNVIGIAFGALLLATAQNLGVWYISSQWQDSIAFLILLIFLLFKPEGFFGNKIKKATV